MPHIFIHIDITTCWVCWFICTYKWDVTLKTVEVTQQDLSQNQPNQNKKEKKSVKNFRKSFTKLPNI